MQTIQNFKIEINDLYISMHLTLFCVFIVLFLFCFFFVFFCFVFCFCFFMKEESSILMHIL